MVIRVGCHCSFANIKYVNTQMGIYCKSELQYLFYELILGHTQNLNKIDLILIDMNKTKRTYQRTKLSVYINLVR